MIDTLIEWYQVADTSLLILSAVVLVGLAVIVYRER